MSIGPLTVEQGGLRTREEKGRYPVWNYYKSVDVQLKKQLDFEPDMRVTLHYK